MPTNCFGRKKKKIKQDLEDGLVDNLEEITEVVEVKRSKFKVFKKSSLEKGQKAIGVVAKTSTKALTTAKTSFEKGADLVISNQEELERVASLAFPGAGLAAKAAIEGVKVANKFVSKIPDDLPDKVQKRFDEKKDLDKISTDLENKLAVDENCSENDAEMDKLTPGDTENKPTTGEVALEERVENVEDKNPNKNLTDEK